MSKHEIGASRLVHPRAQELMSKLQLVPHPEGGFFREFYRSLCAVQPMDGRSRRAALTTIYFLLGSGQISRWHRVTSDEVWHFLEGDALQLYSADPDFNAVDTVSLGRDALLDSVHVIAAGLWQAARCTGDYTLVACSVGPGFEFEDFTMLQDVPNSAEIVRVRHAQFESLI